MYPREFLLGQRRILQEKVKKYTQEWPSLDSPPVHLSVKRDDAMPYILSALSRLDAGTYGICDVCEEYILQQRLEAVPGAIRCRECQEAHENK